CRYQPLVLLGQSLLGLPLLPQNIDKQHHEQTAEHIFQRTDCALYDHILHVASTPVAESAATATPPIPQLHRTGILAQFQQKRQGNSIVALPRLPVSLT